MTVKKNYWGKRNMPRDWSRKPLWKQVLDSDENSEEKLNRKRSSRKSKKEAGVVTLKICDRCGKEYYTFSKKSKYCDACKLPRGRGKGNIRYEEVTKDGERISN